MATFDLKKCVYLTLLHCEWKTVGWRILRIQRIPMSEQAGFVAHFV